MRARTEMCKKWYSSHKGKVAGRLHRKLDKLGLDV